MQDQKNVPKRRVQLEHVSLGSNESISADGQNTDPLKSNDFRQFEALTFKKQHRTYRTLEERIHAPSSTSGAHPFMVSTGQAFAADVVNPLEYCTYQNYLNNDDGNIVFSEKFTSSLQSWKMFLNVDSNDSKTDLLLLLESQLENLVNSEGSKLSDYLQQVFNLDPFVLICQGEIEKQIDKLNPNLMAEFKEDGALVQYISNMTSIVHSCNREGVSIVNETQPSFPKICTYTLSNPIDSIPKMSSHPTAPGEATSMVPPTEVIATPIQQRAKALIMIGMAGSGKTTFMNRLHQKLQEEGKKVYTVNLDPAVLHVPYPLNIDIRDTVNFKQVMKQYKLGPNGAIMTSLNLFATKFDQVLSLLERRCHEYDYFLIDTPGQIEVFNWSASGTIILQLLSSSFPSFIMYLTDTARCVNPVSFTSTMLYCSSVLYKSSLPLLCIFNKTDLVSSDEMIGWMTDYDKFTDASFKAENGDDSYMSSLARSSALAMMQFYQDIETVSVSSATGDGFDSLINKFDHLLSEFMELHTLRLKQTIEHETSAIEEN